MEWISVNEKLPELVIQPRNEFTGEEAKISRTVFVEWRGYATPLDKYGCEYEEEYSFPRRAFLYEEGGRTVWLELDDADERDIEHHLAPRWWMDILPFPEVTDA